MRFAMISVDTKQSYNMATHILILPLHPADLQMTSGESRNVDCGAKGGRECVSAVLICRERTKRTIHVLYRKRCLVEKSLRSIGQGGSHTRRPLPL